jgi:hypothetical protein
MRALDLDALRRAVSEIVRRHESLHMRVEVDDGQRYALRHLRPAEGGAEALRLSGEQFRTPMYLTGAPRLAPEHPGLLPSARPIRDEMQSMPTPERVVPALERPAAGDATPGT